MSLRWTFYLRTLAYCKEIGIKWLYRAQSDPSQWINTQWLQKNHHSIFCCHKIIFSFKLNKYTTISRGTYKLEDLLQVKISLDHSAFPYTHLPFHEVFWQSLEAGHQCTHLFGYPGVLHYLKQQGKKGWMYWKWMEGNSKNSISGLKSDIKIGSLLSTVLIHISSC